MALPRLPVLVVILRLTVNELLTENRLTPHFRITSLSIKRKPTFNGEMILIGRYTV